jgi:anti-sigma B factor antagonist
VDLRIEDRDGTVVVGVSGDVDLATAGALEEALGGAVGSAVVVDLSDVPFMDSTGLNALVNGRRAIVDAGGSIALVVTPEGAVARLLEITGMEDLLPTHSSLEEAGA